MNKLNNKMEIALKLISFKIRETKKELSRQYNEYCRLKALTYRYFARCLDCEHKDDITKAVQVDGDGFFDKYRECPQCGESRILWRE